MLWEEGDPFFLTNLDPEAKLKLTRRDFLYNLYTYEDLNDFKFLNNRSFW